MGWDYNLLNAARDAERKARTIKSRSKDSDVADLAKVVQSLAAALEQLAMKSD